MDIFNITQSARRSDRKFHRKYLRISSYYLAVNSLRDFQAFNAPLMDRESGRVLDKGYRTRGSAFTRSY
jgi:hypothetical protein